MNGLNDMRHLAREARDDELRAMGVVAFAVGACSFLAMIGLIAAAAAFMGDSRPLAISTPPGAECIR